MKYYILINITFLTFALSGMNRDLNRELFEAIENNNILEATTLIYEGANVNERNSSGRLPLNMAAAYGNEGIVNLLLNKGANVNLKDKFDNTAFIMLSKMQLNTKQ